MANQSNGKRPAKQHTLVLIQKEGESNEAALAEAVIGPNLRHGVVATSYAAKMLNTGDETVDLVAATNVIRAKAGQAVSGDLAFASAMLAAQAMALDSMFTELARRAAMNMGEYPQAVERYGRLALKAQSNCRATLEALAKLHQPREQTVRHVHVNDGGQAIVADQFHHHTGGLQNAETAKQSHATGAPGQSAAMLGPDAGRDGLPVASGEGAQAVPDARRD